MGKDGSRKGAILPCMWSAHTCVDMSLYIYIERMHINTHVGYTYMCYYKIGVCVQIDLYVSHTCVNNRYDIISLYTYTYEYIYMYIYDAYTHIHTYRVIVN